MTVVPKDIETFDEDNLENNLYKILNGRHRYEALVSLDKRGKLVTLKGLENREVIVYILRTNCAIQKNYGLLRGNELQASHVRAPQVHEILYVAEGLKEYYSNDQVEEAIVRYCKVLSVHPDEVTALKKLTSWPSNEFDLLLKVLRRYESLQTSDIQSSSNLHSYMKKGLTQPVVKSIFKQLGQVLPEFFLLHADKVLKKELSLKQLVEGFQKIRKRDKVAKVVVKEAGCLSLGVLAENYPGKFTNEILDRYLGAECEGKMKNKKGIELKEYVDSVLRGDFIIPIRTGFVEVDSVFDVCHLDMSEASTIVFNLESSVKMEELSEYLLNLKKNKPSLSFLLLFTNGEIQRGFLNFLSSKRFQGLSPHQVFFDDEKENIEVSELGLFNNLKFALVCTSHVARPPLKVYNGNLSNISAVVEQVTPAGGSVAFVNQGCLPLMDLQIDSSVVYYGGKLQLKSIKGRMTK